MRRVFNHLHTSFSHSLCLGLTVVAIAFGGLFAKDNNSDLRLDPDSLNSFVKNILSLEKPNNHFTLKPTIHLSNNTLAMTDIFEEGNQFTDLYGEIFVTINSLSTGANYLTNNDFSILIKKELEKKAIDPNFSIKGIGAILHLESKQPYNHTKNYNQDDPLSYLWCDCLFDGRESLYQLRKLPGKSRNNPTGIATIITRDKANDFINSELQLTTSKSGITIRQKVKLKSILEGKSVTVSFPNRTRRGDIKELVLNYTDLGW